MRSPTFRNKEKRRKEQKEKEEKDKNRRGPRCHRVPQQHCHSVPVSTPSRNCHHVASRPVCSVSHVEKRVQHCNPVQVHHPETICRKVPNQVCHQEPAPSHLCVENGCNFLPFKFRRNPFLCAKGL